MKKILTVLAIFLFVLSLLAKYLSISSSNEAAQMELEAKRYSDLKRTWGDKAASKAKLLAICDDIGTKYFSATISQKQIDGNLISVSFLVINPDELDLIMQQIINGAFAIKKLEITHNEAAYLVTLEVQI
ncbi:MAG: hypothetical protein RL154_1077 [Pseudomonadota bacterium]|jgi:hypothetical protein